jgi:dolichol-phosphate mannosyltransferase
MKSNLDIIIPIFNEGYKIIELLGIFDKKINSSFRVLLCYDSETDDIFKYKHEIKSFNFDTVLVKNPSKGPCSAVIAGLNYDHTECKIVYPADDFINIVLLDKMYDLYKKNNSAIVVASRFTAGGSMKGCPLLKSILVRAASWSLYFFSSIPVKDASNGFRLFSNKLLTKVNIESKLGFAYSLELLVKSERLKMRIDEIPAQWEERSVGESKFKIFKWLPEYIKWYTYGLKTFWLKKKKPINLKD